MVESSVGQRFSQLIQQLGMSKNAFAMSLDKTATVIQHLVDERNKPGFDLMCKVFEVYPNVSRDWLLLGKGPMMLIGISESGVVKTSEVAGPIPAALAKPSIAPVSVSATAPSFPEPLFAVSTSRLPSSEVPSPSLPAEPMLVPPQEVIATVPAAAASQPVATSSPFLGATLPEAQPVASPGLPAPSAVAPATPPASLDATALTAALHTQYLQHQLALAEQRNQHLLEQQKLMQQMLDLMRRPA